MKKLFTLLFIAGAMSIVACGPSAEEEAARKAKVEAQMDSLANVAAAGMAAPDSTAVAAPDSTAATPAATEEAK